MSYASAICGRADGRFADFPRKHGGIELFDDPASARAQTKFRAARRGVYEPVGATICKPFTGARVALPVPGVAVNVNVAVVRLRNTM